MLRSDVPMLGVVGKSTIKFFKYSIPESETTQLEKLSFQLTSLHGDADLYISKSDPFPQGDEANDKSS